MLLFKTRPTALHKKYSYVYISDDFHLRVEGTEEGKSIAIVTDCHTELYIDPCLSFGLIENRDRIGWESTPYEDGVLSGLTFYEISTITEGLPLMILNSVMYKVSYI